MSNAYTMTIGPAYRQNVYYVDADGNLDQIRDAMCACKEKTGIDPFQICRFNELLSEELLARLEALEYPFPIKLFKDDAGTHMLEADCLCDAPEVLLDIVIFLLNKTDPNLHMIQIDDPVKEIVWVGHDDKGRIGNYLGAGLSWI